MIVAVGNPKGGVGKSTVAVQLALGVMLTGQRAWLVDGDPQGSSAGAALARSDAGRAGLASLFCDDGQELHRTIQANAGKFDHVVIDIGARDSSAFRAALAIADVVLIPVMPRSFDVWALDDMAKLLGEARRVNPVRALAFLNAADIQGADNGEAEAVIGSYDAFELLPCRLYRRKAYANASASGLHVEEMGRRDTTACAEIERLQDAVFGVLKAMHEQPRPIDIDSPSTSNRNDIKPISKRYRSDTRTIGVYMAVTRRPAMPAVAAVDTFIQGAPDARPGAASSNSAGSVSSQRQVKRKISVDIDPDLLARVDEAARASGISRNAALAIGALYFLSEAVRRAT